jgi:diguanylate cyclase (GGDEF)-like protein
MNSETVDICVIEDDPAQRALLVQRLLRQHYRVVEAEDGKQGLRQIRLHRPRVVICDLKMAEMDGIDVCRRVRTDPLLDGTYLILLTAYDSRERKHTALNAGVDDYLCKPFDAEELAARIRNGLRIYRLHERLQHAALTDGLTELWNHTQFRHQLDHEFARTRRYGGDASLLMFDLDHFKAVNDTYGHEVGNRVLKSCARHLLKMVRDTDLVARYGGEEFVVICPHTSLGEAVRLAERIRRSLPKQVRVKECPNLVVFASAGVVCTSDPRVASVTDLVNLADQALYRAKREGRNRVASAAQLGEEPLDTGVRVDEVDRLRKEVVTLSMQAKDLCLQSVWALVQALEARDRYTVCHSRNVTFYVSRLVNGTGWPKGLHKSVINAAMLHDLGKIGVPDGILQKREALSPEEAATIRQVPLMTCKILEPLRVFETEILIIRHLRERYDGTGYPEGLVGADIPIGSRLLAVAETFDALTSDRVYRPHRAIDDAVREICAQARTQFDPQFAALLERVVRKERKRWQAQVDRALTQLRVAGGQALVT